MLTESFGVYTLSYKITPIKKANFPITTKAVPILVYCLRSLDVLLNDRFKSRQRSTVFNIIE